MEYVTLVDENDQVMGSAEKLEAHQKGLLHRAFSILLFDDSNRFLLQKRASIKYHSPGLWTNACCGHPRPGEATSVAATRRLQEELNLTVPLHFLFSFQYACSFSNGLAENEYDHVFVGRLNSSGDTLNPNPDEVSEIRYISEAQLRKEILDSPENFTEWFKLLLPHYFNNIKDGKLGN